MDITLAHNKRYYVSLNLTESELKNLKYIMTRILEQIKVSGNTHYNGDKEKLMKTIIEAY